MKRSRLLSALRGNILEVNDRILFLVCKRSAMVSKNCYLEVSTGKQEFIGQFQFTNTFRGAIFHLILSPALRILAPMLVLMSF